MTSVLPQGMNSARRFLRAIRIEQDVNDPLALEGYILTPQGRQVLQQIEESLRDTATERAWTLTGPYGSGKSSFALFLAQLVAHTHDQASLSWMLLRQQAPSLADDFARTLGDRPLLPVSLTLRRVPIAQSLLEALCEAISALPPSRAATLLLDRLTADLAGEQIDSRAIVQHLDALRNLVVEQGSYGGVLLTLDELGKALEYAARHPGEDIYLLQELAEVASRSQDRPLIVIGILHQAFDLYGERLDLSTRKEWAKVQGRFRDIAFLEPPEQQIRLASAAVASLNVPESSACQAQLRTIADAITATSHAPAGLRIDEFADLAERAYPLHPTLLLALPHLFRRLAQNERSLFAYLQSPEPFGLQERIRERPGDLIRLPDLFDYVAANLSPNLARHTATRRWLEVLDVLDRAPALPPLHINILKTIGILSILGEAPAVQPTRALLSLALADRVEDAAIQEALLHLQTRSLVVFRRFTQTYRIWEGSDVDVEARVEEGWRKVAGQPGLADSLSRFLPQRPLVARRHSYETGALRAFEVRYLDMPVAAVQLKPAAGSDGVIVCCLPATPQQIEAFLAWAATPEIAALPHVLVVVPEHIGALREATDELRALHWAWENTPELRDDRVARRELAERIAQVERMVADAATALLDPRPAPLGMQARWIYGGRPQPVHAPTHGIHLLSRVMDDLFPVAPRIWNELINRRSLSSAAAAARRALIERMLTQADQPLLGLSGFPPERSMYASVLQATGLHREQDGQWGFAPPLQDDPQRIGPAWNAMQQAIFEAGDTPCLVRDLFDRLAAPPYGVLPGLAPVLLATFLIVHADETSLYREGNFVPDPGIADFEVLMRRPELFAIAGSRLSGERVVVVQRLARGLGTKPAILPVVREVLRRVRALPEYAWRTRRLSERSLALRNAIERARSPERLLFYDLPEALDEAPFDAGEVVDHQHVARFFERLNEALQEWQAAAPAAIALARDSLLEACGQPAGDAGWIALRQLARQLDAARVHPALTPFVRRLSEPNDSSHTLDSVLALVAGRPPRSWTDADVDRFPLQAAEIGERFRQAIYRLQVLTPAEEQQTQALIAKVRTLYGTAGSSRVLRAALSRLLEELDDTKEHDS